MEKEEQFFLKRMCDLADLAERQYRPVFSSFLTMYESSLIFSNRDKLVPVSVCSWGGYEEAERKLLCFSPHGAEPDFEQYPLACVQICPKNKKYSGDLTHRDFLGAVLNLGIERSVTGDILVSENSAWMFCMKEMAGFIAEQLERVKHTTVCCQHMAASEAPLKAFCLKTERVQGFVSALRLDAIVSVAFHITRGSVADYIHGRKVFVNGKLIQENSYPVKECDLITVRGIGKFRFLGAKGQSKKGRFAVQMEKFV